MAPASGRGPNLAGAALEAPHARSARPVVQD
ncbi:MAG: hypothetical protein QOG45_2474 [Chloroflexota bacterium]|jgi:hypothetical protein|nr:hypothetical protein [Chloroflexota bacterium]